MNKKFVVPEGAFIIDDTTPNIDPKIVKQILKKSKIKIKNIKSWSIKVKHDCDPTLTLLEILEKTQSENPDRRLSMSEELKNDFSLFVEYFYKGSNTSARIDFIKKLMGAEKISFINSPQPSKSIISSVEVFRAIDDKIQGESVGEILIDDPLKIMMLDK